MTRLSRLALAVASATVLRHVSAQAAYLPDEVDQLATASMAKLSDFLVQNVPAGGCTLDTAVRRREWSDLSVDERQAYISAVMCLQSTPPLTDPALVPGAMSRYDDFLAVHMNQTLMIHATASFLGWHRYFVWAYEKALREECGYQGFQPYWNWGRYAADPVNSPLFDGSPSSMGSNGVFSNYSGIVLPGAPPGQDVIPPDQGGGCVMSGPFANMTVNLGPIAPLMPDVTNNSRPDGFGYNPRCLRRDINHFSSAVTATNFTLSLINDSPDLETFQLVMQGQFDQGKLGVHGGGHFTIGGDPGGDFFTSPGDPAFFLHHGMIDRVWWIWQMQDLATRQNEVSGTLTINNTPPSDNGTLDDLNDLGINAGAVPLRELLSTMGGNNGEFCYVYE